MWSRESERERERERKRVSGIESEREAYLQVCGRVVRFALSVIHPQEGKVSCVAGPLEVICVTAEVAQCVGRHVHDAHVGEDLVMCIERVS